MTPEQNSRLIVFDSTLQLFTQPVASAGSRGLMYGDGCFETFRSYKDKFFKLEEHLERLRQGLEYLGIGYPNDLSLKSSRRFITALLEKNGINNKGAIVRLQVWREGSRGYAVDEKSETHFIITVSPLPDIGSQVALATVSVRRIPSAAVPSRFKLTNGINYILASTEATDKGADDALMLTMNGHVSETPIANIFWFKEGTVYTPSIECDLLPGITRDVIMELVEEMPEVELETGEWKPEVLFEADAAWICNSVREIIPVAMVDEMAFDINHPFLNRLREHFVTYRNERVT